MVTTLRLLCVFLTLLLLCSCSNSEDSEDKNSIKEQTDKVAQEAVEYIQTPIDQAKLAVEKLNIRNEAVEKSVEKNKE